MVYRRKRTFRRRRRVARRSKTSSRKGFTRQVKRSLVKLSEQKYAEAIAGAFSATSTVTITALTMPSQGTTFNARLGDKITFTQLKGRVAFAGADTTNFSRFMIFQWFPDNNVETPVAASILQSPVSVPWISLPVFNKAAKSKFRVLVDMICSLSLAGTDATIRRLYVPMNKMRPVEFNAGVQTGKGVLYYLYVSDSVAVSHPVQSYEFIYKWVDM